MFVFQIQNAVDSGRSLKDAIVGNWKVAEAQQTVVDQPVAVGLLNGVSKIALQIDGWRMCPPDSGTYRFDGAPVEAEDLLNKSFVNIIAPALGFLQYGGGYVVVEFDGKSQFRFVRGYKDKTKWHPC